MKFFKHSHADWQLITNRCFFEADHGRAALAVARLADAATDLPGNAHIKYAEGIILRDYLGRGVAAYAAFEAAYGYSKGNRTSAETARLSAHNAAMLAPGEQSLRNWVEIATKEYGRGHDDDKRFLCEIVSELDRGVTHLRLLIHQAGVHDKSGSPGLTASVTQRILEHSKELNHDVRVNFRKNRAIRLRSLDQREHQLRQNLGECYPPDERKMLIEALSELEIALQLDPYDAEMWNFKGAWLGLVDRDADSLAQFDRAIDLRPHRYARPHINKAQALYKLGRVAESLASAREALTQAEADGSPEQIKHAQQTIEMCSAAPKAPRLADLTPQLQRVILSAFGMSQMEFEQVRKGGLSIELVVIRFLGHARTISAQPSKQFVPLVAQLLGDFTSETALTAASKVAKTQQRIGDWLFWATLYLAAHSVGVQRRDAARLLALMLLVFASDARVVRTFYRLNVLEPSAAATDEMSQLDAIVQDALARINPALPELIASQEPIDEAGLKRARLSINSQFDGPPPATIVSPFAGCLGKIGALAILTGLGLSGALLLL